MQQGYLSLTRLLEIKMLNYIEPPVILNNIQIIPVF